MSEDTVRQNEKGHNFEPGTAVCSRCGMTVREYEDRGRPPCPAYKGERPGRPIPPERRGPARR